MAEDEDLKTFLDDLLSRALHTIWQAGAPLVVTLWAASGLHLADLAHASGRQKAILTVVLPLSSGVLSALKTTLTAYFKANKSVAVSLGEAELAKLHVNMGFVEPAVEQTASAVAAGAVITGDPQ